MIPLQRFDIIGESEEHVGILLTPSGFLHQASGVLQDATAGNGRRLAQIYDADVKFLADVHSHSHPSRATGNDLELEHLPGWAQRTGVTVVGSGACAESVPHGVARRRRSACEVTARQAMIAR